MTGVYFDVSYLAKLHWREPGSEEVMTLAGTARTIACSIHGRTEFAAVGHRKVREKAAESASVRAVFAQLRQDSTRGGIVWLPLTGEVYRKAEEFFLRDPGSVLLRASDALHLACASEHGFTEVYSGDRHFLAAAKYFGLRGSDVIRKGA